MITYTQIVGESRFYQQNVLNDTITGASWASNPTGPTFAGEVQTPTYAKALFTAAIPGNYVVTVTLTLASGQVVEGQAMIIVVNQLV